MALFSRRKKTDDVEPAEPASTPASEAPAEAVPDAAASVGISVSSYRGLGSTDAPTAAEAPAASVATGTPEPSAPPRPRTAVPAEAPAATETIPGLRDNVVLREALAALPTPAAAPDLIEVARQLMQGHLFLRVKGDARALLAEGKDIPLGVAAVGDKQFVLAYSSGAALRESIQADRETDTSAMGQPVLAVIRYVLAGPYAGLVIDNSSAPARAVLPRELLEKLLDQADPSLEVKTLLAGDRTQATASAVAEALTRVKFWVAVNKSSEGRFGVAEARTDDGARLIEIYSHPLEVASLRRGDQAAPMTAEQLAGALRADAGLSGIIVDPGGPWIRLSRADLAPVLALGA
jgi:hypothetical protein